MRFDRTWHRKRGSAVRLTAVVLREDHEALQRESAHLPQDRAPPGYSRPPSASGGQPKSVMTIRTAAAVVAKGDPVTAAGAVAPDCQEDTDLKGMPPELH